MPLDLLSDAIFQQTALPFRSNPERRNAQGRILGAIAPAVAPNLTQYGITTPLRAAHFVAQTCHESFQFSQTQEVGTGWEYEGRRDLGNTEPGDGPRFKGRGLIQLTGRANYRRYSDPPHLDLIAHPELAAEPVLSLRLACRFWTDHHLNEVADLDDCLTASFLVNGGFNGLADRRACLVRARQALGIATPAHPTMPTVQRGDAGAAVLCLQARLRRLGDLTGADGDFGPATARIVTAFQVAHGLAPDGIAGPRTWQALVEATGC